MTMGAITPTAPLRTTASGAAWLKFLGAILAAGLLLVLAVPAIASVRLADIGASLAGVPTQTLLSLGGVWGLGLLAHTLTLTAALPGLAHRRALTLSLTGSAVANVLPLGGAAGMALNHRMTSAWGFDRAAFAAYTVVSNVWDVLAKLAVPVLAVAVLILGRREPGALVELALGAVLLLAIVVGSVASMLISEEAALRLATLAERAAKALCAAVGSRRRVSVVPLAVRVQSITSDVVRSGWRRLTLGMALYNLALVTLLWLCLRATGSAAPMTVVLTAFAVERIATLATITPGGAGLVEVGLVGALLASGGVPGPMVAGAFLYRAFTFGLEIPVGALWLLGWWISRRRAEVGW
jgi:uncharacterized membrane protein YbhN (UPF0104 family)